MTPFTRFRQLAWTALVLAPGFVATACTPVTHGTTASMPAGPAGPAAQVPLPTAQVQTVSVGVPVRPAAEEVPQERWPWPFGADDDEVLRDLEDEFEGGGWTFWPS